MYSIVVQLNYTGTLYMFTVMHF